MCLSALALAALTSLAAPPPGEPVRVLLVTGMDHPAHNWKKSTPAIRSLLEQGGKFRVKVTEDPAALASERLSDYDVVFVHFYNEKPLRREKEALDNLTRFVKGGGGLVVLHLGCGAFPDWPEYANLAGRIWDRKNSHDPRGAFTVKMTETDHPITRGLRDYVTDDELYICLTGERPVTVLATARSRLTGKDHPMAFVFSFGKGRVFHTPLGHDARALQIPGTATLLRRGCAWAAGREP
jgi:type 1 glutamine amidotransferase